MLFGIVMYLTFILLAPPTRLTSRHDTVMMSEEVKSRFFLFYIIVLVRYDVALLWFFLFVVSGAKQVNK